MMGGAVLNLNLVETVEFPGVSVTVNVGDIFQERGAGGGASLVVDCCSFSSYEVSLTVFK